MVIAVLAHEQLKQEFLGKGASPSVEFIWADSVRSLGIIEADLYMDLLFEFDPERIAKLKRLLPKPVLVNAIDDTIHDISAPFIRINAWPTMLNRPVTELVAADTAVQAAVGKLFAEAGWRCQWVPDTVGMVTPRILAMIINEAWYTFAEGTSSKADIDTAMRLGTNYPFGPFEWGQKIGLARVVSLLRALSKTNSRYTIAPSLLHQV